MVFLNLAGELAGLLQVADLLLHRLGQVRAHPGLSRRVTALWSFLGRPADIAGL